MWLNTRDLQTFSAASMYRRGLLLGSVKAYQDLPWAWHLQLQSRASLKCQRWVPEPWENCVPCVPLPASVTSVRPRSKILFKPPAKPYLLWMNTLNHLVDKACDTAHLHGLRPIDSVVPSPSWISLSVWRVSSTGYFLNFSLSNAGAAKDKYLVNSTFKFTFPRLSARINRPFMRRGDLFALHVFGSGLSWIRQCAFVGSLSDYIKFGTALEFGTFRWWRRVSSVEPPLALIL